MDSENILSILATLANEPPGAAPATNVLQAAAPTPPPVEAPVQAAPPPPPPPPAATPPAATPAAPAPEHPRKRLSVIDTIGRLADVFARVGGAEAQYQPTLDQRVDHANAVDLDLLKKTLGQQQVDAGILEPQLAARKRIGTALGALANNPNAAELWPSVAEQAGITDPQQIAGIGAVLQKNPNAAGIFAKALGADIDNLGKNVYFGTDPQGKTVAYQVGPDGAPHILDFSGSGVTPSDPIKVVDTGGAQVIVGSGGAPRRILPKSARPDTLVTTKTQRDIAAGHDATNIKIAGMPARSKTGVGTAPGDNAAFVATAKGNLDELRNIYGDLKKIGAMVSPSQSTGKNVEARLRASAGGQLLEGAIGTQAQTQRDRIASIRPQLMQSIAKATGMTGKQLDSNADVKLFMQTVTNPASSYEANIKAIDGLERFIEANAKKPAAASPKAKSGWSVVGVK